MSVEQRVKKVVSDQLGINKSAIKNESSFINDLDADDIDILELAMALEDEFKCEIPKKDVEAITSVQKAIDYILALAN